MPVSGNHNFVKEDLTGLQKLAPLDDERYNLDEKELAFFKSQTGIQDDAVLKEHIIQVQRDAYEIFPYPCISLFSFAKLKVSNFSVYDRLLKLGQQREGAIFLDIGCCFGTDVRKAVADGFPIQNVVASDIEPGFWKLGHRLFNSSETTFPVPFLAGDALDPSFLSPVPPIYTPPDTSAPDLATLTNLTPLHGHVAAIHASSFFHLFDEEHQLQLGRSLAGLLSPVPGSMIFGSHGGASEKGMHDVNSLAIPMFCHSPESWKALWDGEIFKKDSVKVEAELRVEVLGVSERVKTGLTWPILVWTVTRL